MIDFMTFLVLHEVCIWVNMRTPLHFRSNGVANGVIGECVVVQKTFMYAIIIFNKTSNYLFLLELKRVRMVYRQNKRNSVSKIKAFILSRPFRNVLMHLVARFQNFIPMEKNRHETP